MMRKCWDAVLYNEYEMEIDRETITEEMPYHKIESRWQKDYLPGDHIDLEETWHEV